MQFERPIAISAQTQLQFSRNNVFCDEKITIQEQLVVIGTTKHKQKQRTVGL